MVVLTRIEMHCVDIRDSARPDDLTRNPESETSLEIDVLTMAREVGNDESLAANTAALTEAFRRAVLRLFVRRGIFEADDAEGMLAWPHSGFHVHDGVWVADGDLDFAKRLARYCARNPVALDRLQYDGPATSVQYRSDKRNGPTAVPRRWIRWSSSRAS